MNPAVHASSAACEASASSIGSVISGRDDRRSFDHENYGTVRSARTVDNALRYDESLLRPKVDGSTFEVDDEVTFEDKEELIVVVVLVPVVLTLQDTKPNHGIVDSAKGLVVPTVAALQASTSEATSIKLNAGN